MPYLTVYTNVEIKDGAELAEKSSQVVAETLHKPVNYVVANILYNPMMAHGGSSQNKGALIELKSIGLGDKDKLVSNLTSFFAKELDITNQQYINISLIDCPAVYTAAAGKTFG
ncbi:MAG: phenylpyruvate tautomerase MIF-related protein [Acetobacter sp.]|nr:phenylpyruvate tautomerase MIF-related protein [Acetobacter sp.]